MRKIPRGACVLGFELEAKRQKRLAELQRTLLELQKGDQDPEEAALLAKIEALRARKEAAKATQGVKFGMSILWNLH